MSKVYYIFFGIILAVAAFFRFYQLSSVPPAPTLDEVSIGYNAYSILKTGKDEFGNKLPILLRAYDDYRPALYVYLVIPFEKVLGLSALAVRLPSAILSFLSVIAVYFLAKSILSDKRKNNISLFIMFLFAVSSWSIYISRLGHEANAGLSFLIFGLTFFFWSINTNKKILLPLSALFFALSYSSYQSEKIVIPIITVTLTVLFWRKITIYKKTLIISLFLFLVLCLPLTLASFSPDALIRFKATNIFNTQNPVLLESIKRVELNHNSETFLQRVFDNRRVGAVLLFGNAFLTHLNPAWLLTNTGGENFKIPDFGVVTFLEGFLIIFGLVFLTSNKGISKRLKIFFIIWLIASILPAALTTDYPHAMRAYTILPLPQIIAGLGLLFLLDRVKSKKLIWSLTIFASSVYVIWLYHAYFLNFKREESYRFQYGIEQAFEETKSLEDKYSLLIISNQGVLRASYMYYLFYNKIDPYFYQNSGQNENGRFNTERKIGKYDFVNPADKALQSSDLLLIPANSKPLTEVKVIKEIRYLDNTPSIWVATPK